MVLIILNRDTEKLAQTLADLTGETKTKAVTEALRDRLPCLQRQQPSHRRAKELSDIANHCAALPVLDAHSTDEIPAYDDHGLPS